MNLILAVPVLITTLLLLYRAVTFRTFDFFIWLLLLPFFSIPYFFDCLFLSDTIGDEALFYAGSCALLFNLCFYLTIRIIVTRKITIVVLSDVSSSMKYFLLALLAVSVLFLLMHLNKVFGVSVTSLGTVFLMSFREVGLDDATVYRDIYHRIASIGAVALAVLIAGRDRFWSVIAFMLIFLCILLEGTRWLLIPALGPIIYSYALSRTVSFKALFKLGCIGLAALFLVFHVQTLRYSGDRSATNVIDVELISQTAERIIDFGDTKETAAGEFRLRHFYYYLTENMPSKHEYGFGITYLRMALVGVPTGRSLGLKPRELTKDIADWIYPHRAGFGGTVHPLLYGESYANFGVLGGILGFFWAVMIGFLSRLIAGQVNSIQILCLPVMATFCILLARGAVYSSFFFLVSGAIIILILLFTRKLFPVKISRVR
jgi:hypothetical protein